MVRWHLKHERFGSKPWAVQAEAMRRANGVAKYGQFLEQGLGKTALSLNEFIDQNHTDLNIVLSPNSFMGDWPFAPSEWGLSFLRTGAWPNEPMPFDWNEGVYVVGHETLRGSKRTRDDLLALFNYRPVFLTVDESTGIKNPNSVLAPYVIELSKRARFVRLLNGTPLTLNVMDYYPQLRCLGELQGINPYQFRNRYAKMGGYMGKQVVGINEDRQEELAQLLSRCSFRALKKDWRKDLPPQVQVSHRLEMTDNQRKHYDTMLEEFYADIGDDDPVTANMVLTQRGKLQQISSCMLMNEGKVHWLEPPEKNPKLRAIFDLYDGGQGKALIPYVYKPSGQMLIEEFQRAKLKPAWITGGMTPAEIKAQKDKFNNDSDCRVLVGQIDQTSRGHTLLGQIGVDRCDRTFYYENSLSLMHRLQMNDRNHRGEQDVSTTLHDFITSPIEQYNIDILTGKKSLADGVDAIVAEVRRKGKLKSGGRA